jgi:prevent-host-death family protein
MKVRSVGLRELKTHISEYMTQVQEGDTLLVTVRGKKVGRIIPVNVKSGIDPMLESGHALWSGKKFSPRIKPVSPRGKNTITDLLLENRK